MTACDLSIIIVNWNTRELLAGCLRSIANCELRITNYRTPATPIYRSINLPAAEVFVVDNASTDGSATMVREHFPWVRLIENTENVGFARANNQGIALATGRYVLLLNPDTEIHPGALETLIEFMGATPEAGACGPRLLNGDGTLQHGCHPMLTPGREFWRLLFLERFWPRTTYPIDRWDVATPRQVEVIKGACLLLRRAALDQVGVLDESYFMYTEEVDLCYRLTQAGWGLWCVPAAAVTHYGEGSSRQAAESMYIQLYRSKVQFYRKFGGARRARLAKALLALAYAPRWLAATLGSPFSVGVRRQARMFRRLLAELPGM